MRALKDKGAGSLASKGPNRLERLIEAPEYLAWSLDDWTTEMIPGDDLEGYWGLQHRPHPSYGSITWRNHRLPKRQ